MDSAAEHRSEWIKNSAGINPEGELRCRAIVHPNQKLIKSPSVITTESLEEVICKPFVLRRSIGKLMPREVVEAVRNENILVNVKRCGDSRQIEANCRGSNGKRGG